MHQWKNQATKKKQKKNIEMGIKINRSVAPQFLFKIKMRRKIM